MPIVRQQPLDRSFTQGRFRSVSSTDWKPSLTVISEESSDCSSREERTPQQQQQKRFVVRSEKMRRSGSGNGVRCLNDCRSIFAMSAVHVLISGVGFSGLLIIAITGRCILETERRNNVHGMKNLATRGDQLLQSVDKLISVWKWRGYSIRYQYSGDDGPALVLIHGFGANRLIFTYRVLS